jgi:hypothetical protein
MNFPHDNTPYKIKEVLRLWDLMSMAFCVRGVFVFSCDTDTKVEDVRLGPMACQGVVSTIAFAKLSAVGRIGAQTHRSVLEIGDERREAVTRRRRERETRSEYP